MKKLYLLVFICLSSISLSAQQGFFCVGADGNFSSFPGSTFALGMKGEVRIDRSNWYVTWHYAAGANYNADSYYRSSLALELYKDPNWWEPSPHTHDPLAGLIATLIGPIVCPTGVTDYFYNSPNRRIKAGIYCDLLNRDYWEISNAVVDAWSPELGYKMYYNMKGNTSAYISVGSSFIVNMASGPHALSADVGHLNVSIGLAHRAAD